MFAKKISPKTPPTAPDRQHAFNCIPVRNPEASEQRNSEGILLNYPVEVKPWFQGIFKRVANRDSNIITRKLQLDSLGSSVWRMVDGKQSVRQITGEFQKMHMLGAREAEISVTGFFKELGKRGLLAMREPRQ